jgi:hypothetical protein
VVAEATWVDLDDSGSHEKNQKRKKGLGAASDSVDHTRAQATPASNPTSRIGEPSQDQM